MTLKSGGQIYKEVQLCKINFAVVVVQLEASGENVTKICFPIINFFFLFVKWVEGGRGVVNMPRAEGKELII